MTCVFVASWVFLCSIFCVKADLFQGKKGETACPEANDFSSNRSLGNIVNMSAIHLP